MVDPEHWEWANEQGPRGNVREAVALFDTEDEMQAAVDELETKGFSNTAISRPASQNEVEIALHHQVRNVKDLEDDSEVPRKAFIGPDSRTEGMAVLLMIPVYIFVMAAAGFAAASGLAVWQAIVISLMVGLFGVMVGGFFVYRITKRKVERARREKKWGGFLLWVRTGNNDQEDKAVNILRQHAGRDVHMHGPIHGPGHY